MLGDQLGEDIGQITTTRVLPAENGMPRVEVSFEADGTMIGLHAHDMGTYVGTARPDGTMVGEGNGVLTAENGDVATWHGGGIAGRHLLLHRLRVARAAHPLRGAVRVRHRRVRQGHRPHLRVEVTPEQQHTTNNRRCTCQLKW
jgi:hypothetical protein